ncbi:FAD-dependent oxidoreductase [Pseudooceanicola sp. CBS1P-1]|uniref:FAD-dependent oxidoreductase n=1 Tax=Pseudooceanicola albus TaxID=2692189 RepID=A0A6L7G7E5_9RHOB|nr:MULTISPECIES: FAD-dependent oxidoreductase [Pseudooceanicola]MBT9384317.1 FAD-dependent oxidoreductase [Pseudooceanicola endophyticus]MXN19945.1 FAD-dependent oxidoreductase [Pseudooceanicola albus]
MSDARYDYIVIGSGAAGSVVAARLAEDPGTRVLVLEEGPDDRSLFIKANGGFFRTHGTERTFLFHTEPEPGCHDRELVVMQGRTLGGGTSVNAMCYSRGQHADYDDWAAMGCTGWSYEEVLPYFRRSESNARLSGRYHGASGPMRVSDGVHRHVLTEAFVRAAQETTLPGRNQLIPFNHDFNGAIQEGAGYYQTMSYRGERSSTARSFLARGGENLVVRPSSRVNRILLEGRRAVGVALHRPDGSEEVVRAAREVILSAGTLMTPKLLMLSGIGPVDQLKRHGIEVRVASENVGRGYQDHSMVPYDMTLKQPVSLYGQDRGFNRIRNGLEWLLFRHGPLASNVVEAGGYFDFDGDGRPEIQLNALAVSSAGWGDPIPEDHRFSLAPLCLTCHSRGEITLRSADPADMPVVRTNFLHETDLTALVNGIELSRQICAAPSLQAYVDSESLPGPAVGADRAAIADYVLDHVKIGLHPTSSCAMGSGADTVVDPELRVRGTEGLRIVDGSVAPIIPRGNTTAPIIMIAEKAADLIRGRSLQGEAPAPRFETA